MSSRRHSFRFAVLGAAWGFIFAGSALGHPGAGIGIDKEGQVFFLDTGSGLWKFDTRGALTKLSPLMYHWLALDANNSVTKRTLPSGPAGDVAKIGASPTVVIASDWPVAVGADGTLYHPDRGAGRVRIRRVVPSGETAVFATLPATTTGKPLEYLNGLTIAADGSLYYTENTSVRRISQSGEVSTFASVPALAGGPAIPGIPADTRPYLRGLAVDAKGAVVVASSGDGRVLRITPEGKTTTLVQTQSPWSPTAVALLGDDVYVLEFLHTEGDVRTDWIPRVRKIAPDGTSKIIVSIDRGAKSKHGSSGK